MILRFPPSPVFAAHISWSSDRTLRHDSKSTLIVSAH
jgi:hypothetical protein